MGLLDSVLGAVVHNTGGQQQQQPQGGLAGALGNAFGGAAGGAGLAGILGALASNPQLVQAIVGLLGNNGSLGGLGGLAGKFEQAGLGDVLGSWIGGGHNQAISGQQLGEVLGADTLSQIASQLGLAPHEAAGQLAQALPGVVDQLTPQGQAPQAGLGDSEDIFGMLGGLLQK